MLSLCIYHPLSGGGGVNYSVRGSLGYPTGGLGAAVVVMAADAGLRGGVLGAGE